MVEWYRVLSSRATLILSVFALTVAAACAPGAAPASQAPASAAAAAATTAPTAPPVENLVIGVAAIGTYTNPLFFAKVRDYYKDEHLSVEIRNLGGANNVPALVAEQIDLATQGVSAAFPPVQQGKEMSIVYSLSGNGDTGFLAATGNVKSASECKRLVTGTAATASYGYAALYKAALNASYEIVSTPDTPTQLAMLLSGQVDCQAGSFSNLFTAIDEGKVHLIVDPRDPSTVPAKAPKELVEVGLFGVKDHLQKRSDAIARFIKVLDRAVNDMKGMQPSAIADELRKDDAYKTYTSAQLTKLIDGERTFLTPNVGFVPSSLWPDEIKWVQYALPYVNATDPKWSYESRVDMSYWQAANKK